MSLAAKPNKAEFKRLPTNVIPVNYDLILTPDLEKFTFDGEEKIQLKISESTDKILLNVIEINILQEKSSIFSQNKNLPIQKIDYDVANETATLQFAEPLQPGEVVLNLKFTGILNDKMKGFYRSKYTGPDGKIRNCAVTQFEATDARRAFPCWDEPAHKATFDVTLVVPKDEKIKALSNMAVLNESVGDDKRVVKFTRTPIMSTYLVAFIVGEFDYIETTSAGGVLVRVYTPIGKSDQGKFALDVCARALDFYKQYFQIAYPLNKMDLIAISDFASGAMENWGLVTYRETCVLVDPANTSTIRRQYVALVVAHELAHQWFGNLVTMEWWTHLWLNEGFATFIEYLCVDEIFPNYNIWTQFVADVFLEAMELDGLDNSHPIEVAVGHPSEVDEIFDDISYSKGASVIRMLHKYIGDEAFRAGMHQYLSKHSYRNTQTEDLWDSLEEASKKPVRRVMSTWTKQKGYPVISVTATLDPATNSRVITLSQEKFNLNGQLSDEDRKALWAVPISIITSSSNNKPVIETLLEEKTLTLTLNSTQLGPDEWFKLNPSTVGTFRVSYSPELLNQFSVGIVNQTIPALDRLGLLNDLFALVLAGKQSTLDLLRFINAFRKENNYTVWIALNSILAKFDQLFANSDFHQQYRKYGRDLVNEHAFPWIGWSPKPNEPYLNTLLRSVIINRLVGFEDETVLAECRRMFDDHVSGKSLIPADLRGAVYRGVSIRGDETTYGTFLKLYHQSDLQEEKNRLSGSLGWMKDEKLIGRVLDLSLSDDVRSQDTVFVIRSVASNVMGRELAWKFFQQHKKTFADRYEGGFLISRLVKLTTENFCSEQRADEVRQFFVENYFPGCDRAVQQAIETIGLNAKILQRDSESVRAYLQSL